METVRIFLSIAAQKEWIAYQLDVKSNFHNRELKEEVFVSQPEGFVVKGKEDCVYRLHKALYGLRQAPRAWYSGIDTYFTQLGFICSLNEPTVYSKKEGDNSILLLFLYVDDILYMGYSEKKLKELRSSMMNTFEMSDLGPMRYFLGLEVVLKRSSIFMS